MIKGIVAADRNWAIGKINKKTGVGQLLFSIPADLAYFKSNTLNKICIFGKATYDSLPKRPLPGRVNVVLWDKATSLDCLEGCITFNAFEPLLNFVKILSKEYDVFVCGGASVYKLFLPYYDEVLVTKVDAEDPEATVFFPDIEKTGDFKVVKCDDDHDDNYDFKFMVYERIHK